MEPLSTIIIDDEPEAVSRLQRLLKMFKEIRVEYTTISAENGVDYILQKKPEVVFVDVEMPILSGFDLISKVEGKGFSPYFIITTAFGHYSKRAIKVQAFDYLEKPIDYDELKDTISRLTNKVKTRSGSADEITENPNIKSILTSREIEILSHLLKGMSSKEISEKVFLSKHTVDTYRRKILQKFEVSNTPELLYKISSMS